MFREITSELIKWKDNARRKPFLMLGVRQCGKTYIKLAFIYGLVFGNVLLRPVFKAVPDVYSVA